MMIFLGFLTLMVVMRSRMVAMRVLGLFLIFSPTSSILRWILSNLALSFLTVLAFSLSSLMRLFSSLRLS